MVRPGSEATIASGLVSEMLAVLDTLRHIMPPRDSDALKMFRDASVARHESRWMPLLEVLDEESGLGFDSVPRQHDLLNAEPLEGPVSARWAY